MRQVHCTECATADVPARRGQGTHGGGKMSTRTHDGKTKNLREKKAMNSNPTIPSQTITLDGPDWQIATDPENKGRDEKWFNIDVPAVLAQIVGSAELSERWTVFELAEKRSNI